MFIDYSLFHILLLSQFIPYFAIVSGNSIQSQHSFSPMVICCFYCRFSHCIEIHATFNLVKMSIVHNIDFTKPGMNTRELTPWQNIENFTQACGETSITCKIEYLHSEFSGTLLSTVLMLINKSAGSSCAVSFTQSSPELSNFCIEHKQCSPLRNIKNFTLPRNLSLVNG